MILGRVRILKEIGNPRIFSRCFSTLFVNGKSFVRLSTDFPTLQAITRTDILEETPYLSNNFDNYPKDWSYSSKVIGTRIHLNLSDRSLKLDQALLQVHPAIQQTAVNSSMVTSTGQSRLIIDSPCQQDMEARTQFNDPYRIYRQNMELAEKALQALVSSHVSILIDRDNYSVPELKKLLQHKRKSIDFNIIQAAKDEKVLFDALFEEAYRLDHVYLRSYVRNPATMELVEVKDLASTQVTLSEVVNILKINSFKGSLVLPFSLEHSINNLEIARHVLREHQYTERNEAELQDNWVVF